MTVDYYKPWNQCNELPSDKLLISVLKTFTFLGVHFMCCIRI